jgi:hypothetical protein
VKRTDSGSLFRRKQDFPALVLSMDYELFFGQSGSIWKCLIEPTEMLLEFAAARRFKITFYIDAGMLCRMAALGSGVASLRADLDHTKRHIETIAAAGHEIGLHVHPHWEDTRYTNGSWNFENTRYKLDAFSNDEIDSIFSRYTTVLNDLCGGSVSSYRAGGFCVEPFARIRSALLRQGITVDSSVVPGLYIKDVDKGVDFRGAPDEGGWSFHDSPLQPQPSGPFVEIPVTNQILPMSHYWARAVDRFLNTRPSSTLGNGTPKSLGALEIARRLAGGGRTSELSLDAPKARHLTSRSTLRCERKIWHIMGHPKLLDENSLIALEKFVRLENINRSVTVTGLASAIRAREL